MRFEYTPNPRKIAFILAIISLYLAVQSLISEYLLESVLGGETDSTLTLLLDLLSVNAEETIPTWYATMILFISSMLLASIAAVKRANQDPYRLHWIGLAFIFLYLSMDEGAVIHEIAVTPLEAMFNPTGYLAFSWQIIFVPLVALFVLLYLRFLFHLPARIRNLFIIAGVLYVGGAVVIEGISANRWYLDGGVSFPYLAIATVEELFEMLGVVLFIFALLSYMLTYQYTAVIDFATVAQTAPYMINNSRDKVSRFRPRLITGILVSIVVINAALYTWTIRQQATMAQDDSAPPFYQEVIERYAGQGVVILNINESLEPNNPAGQEVASSLLTLFDDVLVVTLSVEQSSIAFVSQSLPFDQNTLVEILHQRGETQFVILDTAGVRVIAEGS